MRRALTLYFSETEEIDGIEIQASTEDAQRRLEAKALLIKEALGDQKNDQA